MKDTLSRSAIPDVNTIRAALARRGRMRWVVTTFQFALGAALAFVGPVAMAAIAWAVLLFGFGQWWSLWSVFCGAVLVMVPLEFWTEWRTRGDFLTRATEGGRAVSSGWFIAQAAVVMGLSGPSLTMAYGGADPAGLVELMLWGPRQVIAAVHRARVMLQFRGEDLALESRMLCDLLARGRGATVAELCGSVDRTQAMRAVAYLVFFDWAGAGETDEKVWALTEAKETLGIG